MASSSGYGSRGPLTSAEPGRHTIMSTLFGRATTPRAYGPGPGSAPFGAHNQTPMPFARSDPTMGAGYDSVKSDVQTFLGGANRTDMSREGPTETHTVANDYGQRSDPEIIQEIIIASAFDQSARPHYEILPLVKMTDKMLGGVEKRVLEFRSHMPQEAAEFIAPHFIQHRQQVYSAKPMRFNHGCRINMDFMALEPGQQLFEAQLAQVSSDFQDLVSLMITSALMTVNDHYQDQRMVITHGASSASELSRRLAYKGETNSASILAHAGTFGILNRARGFEWLLNWVDRATNPLGVQTTTMLVAGGVLDTIAYSQDRTEFWRRGPEAGDTLHGGERAIARRVTSRGQRVVVEPVYNFDNAEVDSMNMLSTIGMVGRFFVLDNKPYFEMRSRIGGYAGVAGASADDCAAACAPPVNDLYFLDLDGSVTKRRQSYESLMRHALCWDSAGMLDESCYEGLLHGKEYAEMAHQLGISIKDEASFLLDPWIVFDGGQYNIVRIVGNQDVRHTDRDTTKDIVDITCRTAARAVGSEKYAAIDDLLKKMKRNYEVAPDRDGDVEGFFAATAWANAPEAIMTGEPGAATISATKMLPSTDGGVNLPSVVPIRPAGPPAAPGVPRPATHAAMQHPDTGEVLMKVQIASGRNGPTVFNPVTAQKTRNGQDAYAGAYPDILSAAFPAFPAPFARVIGDMGAIAFLSGGELTGLLDAINGDTELFTALDDDTTAISQANIDAVARFVAANVSPDAWLRAREAYVAAIERSRNDVRISRSRLRKSAAASLSLAQRFATDRQAQRLAAAMPSYLWLDGELANAEIFNGPRADLSDPAKSFDNVPVGVQIDDWMRFPKNFLWSARMARIGLPKTGFHFGSPSDFAQARFVAASLDAPNGLQLPGFSTVAAMRRVARTSLSSVGMNGWSSFRGAEKYFREVQAGINALDEYTTVLQNIFCDHSDGGAANIFFRERMLAHYARSSSGSDSAEENQRTAFQQNIIDQIKAPVGMVMPFAVGNLTLIDDVPGDGQNPPELRSMATLRTRAYPLYAEGRVATWLPGPATRDQVGTGTGFAEVTGVPTGVGAPRRSEMRFPTRAPSWFPAEGNAATLDSIQEKQIKGALIVADQYDANTFGEIDRIIARTANLKALRTSGDAEAEAVMKFLLWGNALNTADPASIVAQAFAIDAKGGLPSSDGTRDVDDRRYNIQAPQVAESGSLIGMMAADGSEWSSKYPDTSFSRALGMLTDKYVRRIKEAGGTNLLASMFAFDPDDIAATAADFEALMNELRSFSAALLVFLNLVRNMDDEDDDDEFQSIDQLIDYVVDMADETSHAVSEARDAAEGAGAASSSAPRTSVEQSASRFWASIQALGRTLPVVNMRLSVAPNYWDKFDEMVRSIARDTARPTLPGFGAYVSLLRPHSSVSPGAFVAAPPSPNPTERGRDATIEEFNIDGKVRAVMAEGIAEIRKHGGAYHGGHRNRRMYYGGCHAALCHAPRHRYGGGPLVDAALAAGTDRSVPLDLAIAGDIRERYHDLERETDEAAGHRGMHMVQHPGIAFDEMPNACFYKRAEWAGPAIARSWKLRAAFYAYMGARPSAQLMINMHRHGIPQPMTLIPFDPFITFRMNSVVFVKDGRKTGFIGHHLTAQARGFDSDKLELTVHFITTLMPFISQPKNVVQIPHASFSAYLRGGSGRIATLTSDRDMLSKDYGEDAAGVWDPTDPKARTADRFVAYAGGSCTKDSLGENISLLGSAALPECQVHAGSVIPDTLVPRIRDNNMSYPSAIMVNYKAEFHLINRDAEDGALRPKCLYDIRQCPPDENGSHWNVWMTRGNQWQVDPATGRGTVRRMWGTGALGPLEPGVGHIFNGAPGVLHTRLGDTSARVTITT